MIKWIALFVCTVLCADTIEEKRASCVQGKEQDEDQYLISEFNQELKRLRAELQLSYMELHDVHGQGGDVQGGLEAVNQIRQEIWALEDHWRRLSIEEMEQGAEEYGLFDQEDSTVAGLVMEYGAPDYLYVIPPELMKQKISLHSGVAIPRQSWSTLLEIILSQNGIGIKQASPLVRQLFSYKQDLMGVRSILNKRSDLTLYPPHERVVFIFSPRSEDIKSVFYFFERFRDPKRTYIHQVGNKVALVATCEEVEKLLALYDAVWEEGQQRIAKVIPLAKLDPQEMEKILKIYFGASTDQGRMTVAKGGAHLTMLPLKHEGSLALIGIKETVDRAETIIRETEAQIEDPLEMTVYWYACRHSDPVDLSDVLEKVYSSLVRAPIEGSGIPSQEKCSDKTDVSVNVSPQQFGIPATPAVVKPQAVEPAQLSSQQQKSKTLHFIPYTKTGSIMMVVRRDVLPKIKQLLRKLDVPKKMVQIDVLIFERKLSSKNNFGLNILKLGSAASNKHKTGLDYSNPGNSGILDFFISRKKSAVFPAFDLAYSFLMSQEDVRVNAAPSITTINQTPAKIAIVEEVSVNNGVAPVQSNGATVFEKSFSRNQFGITLVITPTIHEPELDDEDQKRYVTMETNITFDNPQESSHSDQPNVDRSNIENQVRVLDGETLILGGLRRKTAEDSNEKIPFLGEIPGIAKLFGTSRLSDKMRELFVFITPRVIVDPEHDVKRIREESLKQRAGDIPEFLERLKEAQNKEKCQKFKRSFDLMFGGKNDC